MQFGLHPGRLVDGTDYHRVELPNGDVHDLGLISSNHRADHQIISRQSRIYSWYQ